MVKGMITIATQQEAVARADSVRVSSAATRGSGRGATATRAAATALVSAWAFFSHPMIQKRISVPWAMINDGGRILAVSEPSYRLLVVDDEPLALNLAKRVFETESDIALHAATSAVRALEMAMIHDIDLVITDPLIARIATLEVEVGRVLDAGRAASRAIQKEFAPDEVERLKEATLRAAPDLAGSVEESIAAVRTAGAQLEALARGVQSYTANMEPEPFDINQAVLAAVQLLSHRLRESVHLERKLEAVPLVRCRGPEITQVVLSLLGNAVDAVQRVPEPLIEVRTSHEGSRVRLEVADNGTGLDPGVAQRLFKPFTSTNAGAKGRELGLSICKSS